ncbi:ABC-three component system middle component 6 [Prosthecobacter algae]|uniref:ABC-three component system middle component 6 n=1 Tax=Prosthecobacter algae TaxID=1144682 RepID=UPI0031EFF45B
MILPTKHLSQDRAILTVGARILQHLSQAKTISSLWEELPRNSAGRSDAPQLRYDAFVLALDLLFMIGAIEVQEGLLTKRKVPV